MGRVADIERAATAWRWQLPSGRSFCASMRKARSRRSIEPNRPCRCSRAPRNGPPMTTSATAPRLFAALEMGTGLVYQQLHRRRRAVEFKKFLDHLDREVPNNLDVHVILDNYAAHKTPAIKKWLVRHPRFVFHFIPTSASWLNLVERWCPAPEVD